MYKLFLFDMDGVLLRHRSSWEYCQEAIGCDVEHFYDEFREDIRKGGDIIELVMQKMSRYGFSKDVLRELALNAPQLKGVKKVMDVVRANGGTVVIISGGIGDFAQVLKGQYSISEYVCNEVHFDEGTGPPTCEIRVGFNEKGLVARKVMAERGVSREETVAVGDRGNDCAMFAEAGLSIAFNGDEMARAAATRCVDSDDLASILTIVFG
jgi:HAD superfamily phosphoserine phosphatase-like hydrolase